VSVVSIDTRAAGRKAYQEYGSLQLNPRSKGTWTVFAAWGLGNNSRQRQWTGLDSQEAVADALAEAWAWLAEQSVS
jgi:hypothetical protein